jgi:hypothetical protein
MRRFLRDNSLTTVLLGVFVVLLWGQSLTGYREYNSDQQEHQQPVISYGEYLTSGHFAEATFENWESEFLQMAAFVLLTIWLKQKGSSESKKPEGGDEVDKVPRRDVTKNSPWPVRHGGVVLKIYESSLSLAFVALFALSFTLHAVGGASVFNEEEAAHGSQERVTVMKYITTSRFWFESLQNWQSEFLAVGCIALFSIFLRQKGSPESKPVAAPYDETPGS